MNMLDTACWPPRAPCLLLEALQHVSSSHIAVSGETQITQINFSRVAVFRKALPPHDQSQQLIYDTVLASSYARNVAAIFEIGLKRLHACAVRVVDRLKSGLRSDNTHSVQNNSNKIPA